MNNKYYGMGSEDINKLVFKALNVIEKKLSFMSDKEIASYVELIKDVPYLYQIRDVGVINFIRKQYENDSQFMSTAMCKGVLDGLMATCITLKCPVDSDYSFFIDKEFRDFEYFKCLHEATM